jgi:hypothetical protein
MKNIIIIFIVFAIVVLMGCQSKDQKTEQAGEDYHPTDLPFEGGFSLVKGGGYDEVLKADGSHGPPHCSGISVKSLKLYGHEIPLKANVVTSDCFIETKDYGKVRIKMDDGFSFTILVTARQEQLFRKLAHQN